MDYFKLIVSDEQKMIVDVIRRFVDQEIMPVRDQIDDDTDHVLINKILGKLSALGVFRAAARDETAEGASPMNLVTSCAVIEEMARGDVGIGIVAGINGWAMAAAAASGNKEVLGLFQKLSDQKSPCLACFAMTEPASGCDVENLPELHGRTIATRAVRDGDSWVINGAKRFPSSAGVASIYCVVCQTDPGQGEKGVALIYVPADAEGLSFGKFEKKAGMQADRNCDIYFDRVRVPLAFRASGPDSPPGADAILLARNLTIGRVVSAAAAVGCTQGAWEEVLRYTGERVVAGKPIREHSIAAGILADIITGIETARAYTLQVAYMLSHPETYGEVHGATALSRASMAKNYACDTANTQIGRAMELMASYGYLRDYHVEKYWRDVKEVQLWLGGKQLGQFDAVRAFYPYKVS